MDYAKSDNLFVDIKNRGGGVLFYIMLTLGERAAHPKEKRRKFVRGHKEGGGGVSNLLIIHFKRGDEGRSI